MAFKIININNILKNSKNRHSNEFVIKAANRRGDEFPVNHPV